MEDWWLVRDSRGQVGWLLARRLDVDVPDEIARLFRGQKIVGAYVLTKVYDPESSLPDKLVPEYISVTNAYKDGLPYDFDQVRIFTWNVKKHRYETAYRQRNIEGYLPVTVSENKNVQGQPIPAFSIKVATSDAVTVDPLTGAARPAQTETLSYQLEGGMVKRVTPAGGSAPRRYRRSRSRPGRSITIEERQSRLDRGFEAVASQPAFASMCIRWLVERTAGPHSTSLRAGSPLRFAPVGMTIHILVRMRVPKKNQYLKRQRFFTASQA